MFHWDKDPVHVAQKVQQFLGKKTFKFFPITAFS
jgi:hypothetical protein